MSPVSVLPGPEPARLGSRGQPIHPCILVLFGASGDLTRRLLIPSLYNLACEQMLPEHFTVLGVGRTQMTTEQFRERLTADIRKFSTRLNFDAAVWNRLVRQLHYLTGDTGDPAVYQRLAEDLHVHQGQQPAGGSILFYLATPPSAFGPIATLLAQAGLHRAERHEPRLLIEKPFGQDLASAIELNRQLLANWPEKQIYRIDHYLGKETVQNLLTARFSNGIFEPLWNKNQVDHIQFTVAETVGVEKRGKYYDQTGVLRDMIQNHMFQMLAYVCMEPPTSFQADAVRNEKAKLLDSVRLMTPDDVRHHTVRGQYGPGRHPDGAHAVGYREEPDVHPQSSTETFAALRLFIDNWRWEGVPIYLRSGKSLWKRGTEIVVQFKKAPEVLFRNTPSVGSVEANKLVFHMQPDQGIEFRLHAKTPGPTLALQKVGMRFDYREAFESARGTGYEVLLYNAMQGDATLFSRTDLVESAWRIAQPVLDAWAEAPPTDFPNYAAGSWGPRTAYDLMAADGRNWIEIVNRDVLDQVPLLKGTSPVFLRNLALMVTPRVYSAGDLILQHGQVGHEMFIICRGQVEVLDAAGRVLNRLGEGEFFGEMALLLAQPRTASIRALTPCDLFVLSRKDLEQALKGQPDVERALWQTVERRTADNQKA